MDTSTVKMFEQWNENRIRMEELRKQMVELQEKQDKMSKRIIQYMQEQKKKQAQFGSVRIQLAEVNVYPNFSQKLVLAALKALRGQDAEEIHKYIVMYRKNLVQKTTDLKILSK